MAQLERSYRTLVVSASAKFSETILPILTSAQCEPISFAESISAAKRSVLENQYDFIIINAPLPDEPGTRFAIDSSAGRETVCLLFVRAEFYHEIHEKVTPRGVFTLQKPISTAVLSNALDFMAVTRERLRTIEKKTMSLEEKMEEIRVVNRAKWLLINYLGLTEPDAHRYIEKHAMDNCVTRSEIAKDIIKTYS